MEMGENMIRGFCVSNLDEAKREEWPTSFVAVPRVGDRVEAKSGASLAVVSVTHCLVASEDQTMRFSRPAVRIELHKGR